MIDHYEFGRFIIQGKTYETNIKLLGEEIKPYKHLNNHDLNLGDLTDLINSKPSYLIIGTGAYGVIKVKQSIKDFIENQKIRLIIAKTPDACNQYNQLIKEHKKVAAFLHPTC